MPKASELERQFSALLAGETVEFVYESVRLYMICQAMEWAHLPEAGGIYDQHPLLLDEWEVLHNLRARHEKAENAKRDREMDAQTKQPRVR